MAELEGQESGVDDPAQFAASSTESVFVTVNARGDDFPHKEDGPTSEDDGRVRATKSPRR